MNIDALTWEEYLESTPFDWLLTFNLNNIPNKPAVRRMKMEWDVLKDNCETPTHIRGIQCNAQSVSCPVSKDHLEKQLESCRGSRIAIVTDDAETCIKTLNSRSTRYLSSLVGSNTYFAIICGNLEEKSDIQQMIRHHQLWWKQWTIYIDIEPGKSCTYTPLYELVDCMPRHSNDTDKLFSICVDSSNGNYIDYVTVCKKSSKFFSSHIGNTMLKAVAWHILENPRLQSHTDYNLSRVIQVRSMRSFGRWLELLKLKADWKVFIDTFGKANIIYERAYRVLRGIVAQDVPRSYDHIFRHPIFYKVFCGHLEKLDPASWKYFIFAPVQNN